MELGNSLMRWTAENGDALPLLWHLLLLGEATAKIHEDSDDEP